MAEQKDKFVVYMLTIGKDKHRAGVYFGQTSDINERFLKHKSDLRINNHHSHKLQEYYNEWKDLPSFSLDIKVLEENLTLEDSLILEKEYIKDNEDTSDICNILHTKDYSIVRSEILKRYWKNEKYRELHSEIGKERWKDPEWIANRKEFYENYDHPDRIKVTINGITYRSFNESEEKTGVSRRTISDRCVSNDPMWRHYTKEGESVEEKFSRLDWSKITIINGTIFFYLMDVANKFEISHPTVRRRIKSKNILFSSWFDYFTFVDRFGEEKFIKLLDLQHSKSPI